MTEEALAVMRHQGDPWAIALEQGEVAMLALLQGDHRGAAALLEEWLHLAQDMKNQASVAHWTHVLGEIAVLQGDYARAQERCEASAARFKEIGDPSGVAAALTCLSHVARLQGDHSRAKSLAEESLSLLDVDNKKPPRAHALAALGAIAQAQGLDQQAADFFESGLALGQELGDRYTVCALLRRQGQLALTRGRYTEADTLLRESLRVQQTSGPIFNLSIVAALEMLQRLSTKLEVALDLSGLAELARANGQPERAAQLLGAAGAIQQEIALPVPEPERTTFEQTAAAVSSVLGEVTFAQLYASGQALSPEQAVAYALEDAPPAPLLQTAQPPVADARDLVQLSPREREVAALIARGLTNHEIAEQLLIADRTVATHVEHILEKLGFTSRIQVGIWATKQGLREPNPN